MKKHMIKKITQMNFNKMNKLAKVIAKNNDKDFHYVKSDMIKNFLKYGIGYTDYLKSDFINLTDEEKLTHLTARNYTPILLYLNDKDYRVTTNDKIVFNRIFRDYIKRKWIDLRITSKEDFKKFCKKFKVIFAKRHNDFGGHGIKKIIVKDIENYDKLYNNLKKNGNILIEEEIKQHETMEKLNPFAVNSIRVISLYKDGKVHIIGNAFRINITDEEAVGTSDAFARLNPDGTFASPICGDVTDSYEKHPITGVRFHDYKIPFVKEAFKMIEEAGKLIPNTRYVGWDVVITPNGPAIMEGNEYPSYGLIQYFMVTGKKTGHLKDIKDVLGKEFDKIKI